MYSSFIGNLNYLPLCAICIQARKGILGVTDTADIDLVCHPLQIQIGDRQEVSRPADSAPLSLGSLEQIGLAPKDNPILIKLHKISAMPQREQDQDRVNTGGGDQNKGRADSKVPSPRPDFLVQDQSAAENRSNPGCH